MKMRTPKYASKMPQIIEDAKNVKFSVEMREKYLTAVLATNKGICTKWQNRIKSYNNLYDYIQDDSISELTMTKWDVAGILSQQVFDAISEIDRRYLQAKHADKAYNTGDHDANAKNYFQCNLPSEFHSKKVFTLTGVHKADEIRAYYKLNKGVK
jgi:hypothetical protein